MNDGSLGLIKVYHQEQVAGISITGEKIVFAMAGEFNLLFVSRCPFSCSRRFQYRPSDDECVVREDAADVVQASDGIGCLVAFQEIDEQTGYVEVSALVGYKKTVPSE